MPGKIDDEFDEFVRRKKEEKEEREIRMKFDVLEARVGYLEHFRKIESKYIGQLQDDLDRLVDKIRKLKEALGNV